MESRDYFIVTRGDLSGDPISLMALEHPDGVKLTYSEIVKYFLGLGYKVSFPAFHKVPDELDHCLFLVVREETLSDHFDILVLMPYVLSPDLEMVVLRAIRDVEDGWYDWIDSQLGLDTGL